MTGIRFPAEQAIILYSSASTPNRRSTKPRIEWASGSLFQEIKRPVREVHYSLPSNTKVKKGGATTPVLLAPLWGGTSLLKHLQNFTFVFYLLLTPFKVIK